jgi:ABC-type dipeptide/oligopeptide/nickel transport system ATPase subunit
VTRIAVLPSRPVSIAVQLERGEALTLVAEPSCGKTEIGRTLVRLLVPITQGVPVDGLGPRDGCEHASKPA